MHKIRLTERDEKILQIISDRNIVTSKYMALYFASQQAALQRLKILTNAGILNTKKIDEVLYRPRIIRKEDQFTGAITEKKINANSPVSEFIKHTRKFSVNSVIFYLTREAYGAIGIKKNNRLNQFTVVHQLYQEHIELWLINKEKVNVEKIKASPELNPQPDLYFEHKGKNFSIEIERSPKRLKKAMHSKDHYIGYIDRLMGFSNRVIYYFEKTADLKTFLKDSYSPYLYCGLVTNPDQLYDHNKKPVLLGDVMNGK